MKKINFKKYRKYQFLLIYVIGFILITPTIYLSIPFFYDYKKSEEKIVKKINEEFDLKVSVEGKIRYRPLPLPSIKIEKLIIKDFMGSKNLGEVENAIIKISINELANLEKIRFKQLVAGNAKINLNLNKLNDYIKYFFNNFKSKNIRILDGNIQLYDGKEKIGNLKKINLTYKPTVTLDVTNLRGSFLGNNFTVTLKNDKKDSISKILIVKIPNLKISSNIIFTKPNDKNLLQGNGSFYFYHNRANLKFDIKDSTVKIHNGNIKNKFLNGKISGLIKFLPFFNFDLNLDIKTLKFADVIKILKNSDDADLKDHLIFNENINGSLNININKVYSSSKIVKSAESRIQLVNQNILIDQLLLDLGKLGAADITGIIKNDNNYSNLIFKKNLFIDNAKLFYNRFGVYNKKTDPENMFISGSLNLKNFNFKLKELNINKKLNEEDIKYYEKELNEIVFKDGYNSLFDFLKLKEFVKLSVSE